MSYTIDTATRVHDRQVAAVHSVQSKLVRAVDVLNRARRNAPQAPEQLTDAVQKVAAPLIKVVGTPSEARAFAVASSRDWLEVQRQFQAALLNAVSPVDVTVEVPAATRSKKKS